MAELTTTGTNPTEPAAEEGRPTSDRLLLILAVDHRNSLERDLYGLAGTIGPAEAARISADKLLVYQALLDALPRLPAEVQPGILIDEQYGASVAELAGRSQGVVSLAMPIEASGEEWFEFAYGDDWTGHAEFFATDFAKVLMRDNPGFDAGRRAEQADRLSQVSRWAEASGRAFIIELLVPATDTDLAAVDGDRDRYDDEVRPRHTLAVMEHLQDHGVDPALWKVEGLDRHDDAVQIAGAAKRDGRTADCIVLGRHAPHDQLDHWLRVAAPIPGWTGFAIGRSIWWDALHARLHHHCTASEARHRIREAYVDFARYYIDARAGDLPDALDPEYW